MQALRKLCSKKTTSTTRHEHNNEKIRVRLTVLLKYVIKVHCYVFVERSVRAASHIVQQNITMCLVMQFAYGPRHEKTGFLHMRKQRRRSASR